MSGSGRNQTTISTVQLVMRVPRMDDIEKAPDRMERLLVLARQAREAGQIKYAELLEQQALRTGAEPDGSKPENSVRATGRPGKCGSVKRDLE